MIKKFLFITLSLVVICFFFMAEFSYCLYNL